MKITKRQLRKLILREVRAIIERPNVDIDDMLDNAEDMSDVDDDMSDVGPEDKFPSTRAEALEIAKKIHSEKMNLNVASDYGLHSKDSKGYKFNKKDSKTGETFTITKKELE